MKVREIQHSWHHLLKNRLMVVTVMLLLELEVVELPSHQTDWLKTECITFRRGDVVGLLCNMCDVMLCDYVIGLAHSQLANCTVECCSELFDQWLIFQYYIKLQQAWCFRMYFFTLSAQNSKIMYMLEQTHFGCFWIAICDNLQTRIRLSLA